MIYDTAVLHDTVVIYDTAVIHGTVVINDTAFFSAQQLWWSNFYVFHNRSDSWARPTVIKVTVVTCGTAVIIAKQVNVVQSCDFWHNRHLFYSCDLLYSSNCCTAVTYVTVLILPL